MLIHGDCLEELKKLEENSIDSLVTDPPAGISFMNKKWDSDKGGRDEWIKWMTQVMAECKRVLKPGAHALVWAIPRTSHWTTTAIEDAGFEIRDVITHLFGSGFPKSLDISKAIDKEAGAKREVLATISAGTGPLKRGHVLSTGGGLSIGTERSPETYITAPSTDDAKKWSGFGTSLKPAAEFWILARKPISEKTVAKNVLRWSTGALNIDGSRIGSDLMKYGGSIPDIRSGNYEKSQGKERLETPVEFKQGRFPANLVFSHTEWCTDEMCDIECAIKRLDEQAKQDASRFFYVAKVSSSERGESTHPTMKSLKLMQYLIKLITPPGGTVLDPFMGSGSTGLAAKNLGFNFIGIEREQEYFEISSKRYAVELPETV